MSAAETCRLIGRWRIFEADLWDRAYLNLSGPGTLTITAEGSEITSGALETTLYIAYARDLIDFRWHVADEGDEGGEVAGEGSAELRDDGTLEIEFSFNNGDDAVLTAKRETSSSTAC